MNPVVIGAIALAILVVIYLVARNQKPKGPTILEMFSPNGRVWVKMMCDMFDNGETWTKNSVKLYEKMFNEPLPLNDRGHKSITDAIGLKPKWRDAAETSGEYRAAEFYDDLQMGLILRHGYQFHALKGKTEAETMKKYGLNIGTNELLYYHASKIDWHEEKTVRTTVAYRGFSYRAGGPMSYKTGQYDIMATHTTDFVPVDRGDLFITSKRIIFIGKENRQNRTLDLDDLLEFSIYRDGILLGKANGRKPLIIVPGFKGKLIPRDNLSWIIRVLERVMSKTQDMDLTPKDFEEV